VPAGKTASLPVEWQKTLVRNVTIDSSLGASVLSLYLKGGKAPPEIAKALEQVLATKAELEATRTEAQRLRAQHAELDRDQERVRENLNTLRKTKGNQALIAELAQKLAKQEEELGKLSGKLVQLSETGAELERKLKALIKTVSLKKAQ
jgi:chromosome segregation ATPase